MFAGRTDAGQQLAAALTRRGVAADVVLAIPRGGLPVGRPVADALGLPLDVVAARKIGAPANPELAIGAVAADGSVWRNDDLIDRLEIDEGYVERGRERERRAATEKLRRYRADRPPLELDGTRVVVVDDGVATGATTIACLREVRNRGAEHVVLAVPVAPPESVARLRAEADDVVVLETPAGFGAVGRHYRNFEQVTDEAAMGYLEDR